MAEQGVAGVVVVGIGMAGRTWKGEEPQGIEWQAGHRLARRGTARSGNAGFNRRR